MALEPESSSGSYTPPTEREDFVGGLDVTIANGASASLQWAKLQGDTMLDLSDPAVPVVVTAGIYAVSVTSRASVNMTVGGFFTFALELDSDNQDVSVHTDAGATAANLTPFASLAGTYYIPAGGTIRARVANHDGASKVYNVSEAFVQRVT